MWNVFSLAKEAGVPPSEFMHLDDPYVAYCFDEVVLMWGSFVTHEVREAGEAKKTSKQKSAEGKQDRKFKQLMGTPDEKRFATPVATK